MKDFSDNGVFLTIEPFHKRLNPSSVPVWLRRRYSPLAIGLTEGSEAFVVFNVPKRGGGHYRFRVFGQVLRLKEELPPAQFSVAMRLSTTELLSEV